jgi:hypothetical protein
MARLVQSEVSIPLGRIIAIFAVCLLFGEATVWLLAGTYFSWISPMPWAENMFTKWGLVIGYGSSYTVTLLTVENLFRRKLKRVALKPYAIQFPAVAKGLAGGLVLYEVLYIALGGLTARETVGNLLTSENSLYWLRAVEGYPVLASLYLYAFISYGARDNQRTLYWISVSVIGLYCLLLLASGGRGGTVILLSALLLFRITRSGIKSILGKKNTYIGLAAVLVTFYVVGELRTFADYSSQSERIEAFLEQRAATSDSTAGDAIEKIMFRLSELYGHVVINRCLLGEASNPFLNVERLFLTMVPAAFVPSKQPLDDGPENLALYFGFGSEINEFKSLPITLQADLFWRFGYLGPVVGGIIVAVLCSLWLNVMFRSRLVFFGPDIFVAYLAVHLLRLYPSSILGVIGILTYKMLRDVVFFSLVICVLTAFAKRTTGARS